MSFAVPFDQQAIQPGRSLLFTPANRPESFTKALKSGADKVCVDLEDAVPAEQKAIARSQALGFLREAGCEPNARHVVRMIRINSLSSQAGIKDLTTVLDASPAAGILMLPKVCEAAEVRLLDKLLTETASPLELAVLIETLDGLANVMEIAAASGRLRALVFGALDLSAEMGAANEAQPMAYARNRVIHAGRRFGLEVIDTPSLDFRNVEAIKQEALNARTLGFSGKALIHPIAVEAVNSVFTPSAAEIAQAEKIIAAYKASANGLSVVDGQLIEAPVIKAMQQRLAIAKAIGAY